MAARQRDDAAGLDRMRRVDDEVHEHLVQLRREAAHRRQHAVVLHDVGLVLHLVEHDVQGRVQPGVQVGLRPVGVVDPREVLEILDDPLDATQAVGALAQKDRQVLQHVLEVDVLLRSLQALA